MSKCENYTNPACVDGACPNVNTEYTDGTHILCENCIYGFESLGCEGCIWEHTDECPEYRNLVN